MDVLEALKQLDPANDADWTANGLPKVEVVGKLLGRDVTRTEISDAAPDFNRGSAVTVTAEPDPEPELATREAYAEALDAMDLRIAAVNEEITAKQHERERLEKERDALLLQRDSQFPPQTQKDMIEACHRAQMGARSQRAIEELQRLASMSPVDRFYAQRQPSKPTAPVNV